MAAERLNATRALEQQEFLHGILTVQNNTQSQEFLGD
jgi:hypothetical protein